MGRRILVVEDEPLLLFTVLAELEDRNFDVTGADAGPEAFRLLEDRPFDALLTDIRLPGGVDGWMVAERARDIAADIAVIYMTGFAPDPKREVPPGVLVQKPFKIDSLVRTIETALEQRHGR